MDTLQLSSTKRYTFADYLTWFDDKRRELFDGFVKMMTPAPRRIHQEVSGELYFAFKKFLKKEKCKVYHAPFDVRLPESIEKKSDKQIYTVVQPDISIICDPEKLDDKGCIGAPDLIIEIISPSTSRKDQKDKYFIYEKAGVKEYWIAYPYEKSIHVFILNPKEKYELKRMYVEDDIIKVGIFNDFKIDLTEIFTENSD